MSCGNIGNRCFSCIFSWELKYVKFSLEILKILRCDIKHFQRSFPLTEEEYLLRLDDVANNLKCWGAVSYVRNSLAKTKERPRIGKVELHFHSNTLQNTVTSCHIWLALFCQFCIHKQFRSLIKSGEKFLH